MAYYNGQKIKFPAQITMGEGGSCDCTEAIATAKAYTDLKIEEALENLPSGGTGGSGECGEITTVTGESVRVFAGEEEVYKELSDKSNIIAFTTDTDYTLPYLTEVKVYEGYDGGNGLLQVDIDEDFVFEDGVEIFVHPNFFRGADEDENHMQIGDTGAKVVSSYSHPGVDENLCKWDENHILRLRYNGVGGWWRFAYFLLRSFDATSNVFFVNSYEGSMSGSYEVLVRADKDFENNNSSGYFMFEKSTWAVPVDLEGLSWSKNDLMRFQAQYNPKEILKVIDHIPAEGTIYYNGQKINDRRYTEELVSKKVEGAIATANFNITKAYKTAIAEAQSYTDTQIAEALENLPSGDSCDCEAMLANMTIEGYAKAFIDISDQFERLADAVNVDSSTNKVYIPGPGANPPNHFEHFKIPVVEGEKYRVTYACENSMSTSVGDILLADEDDLVISVVVGEKTIAAGLYHEREAFVEIPQGVTTMYVNMTTENWDSRGGKIEKSDENCLDFVRVVDEVAEAKSYADEKKSEAISEAEEYARTLHVNAKEYATDKSNNAISQAKTYTNQEIEKLRQEIPSGGTNGGSCDCETVPAYVKAEAAEVADKIIASRTANSLVLLMATDLHIVADPDSTHEPNKTAIKHMGQGMNEIRNYITPDGVMLLGDYVYDTSNPSKQEAIKAMKFVKQSVEEATRGVLSVWLDGNHDYYRSEEPYRLTDGEHFALVGANNSPETVVDKDNLLGNYGYVDFEKQRVRVIYLNTSDTSTGLTSANYITPKQGKWLIDTLLDLNTKSDAEKWGIVVCSHFPIYAVGSGGSAIFPDLTSVLGNYKDKASGKNYDLDYDFSNVSAELIATFHGHIHNFKVTDVQTAKGETIKAICIPNACQNRENPYDDIPAYNDSGREFVKNPDSKNDTSFNAIVIERDSKNIYAFNYGAGIDREIFYGTADEPETQEPVNQIPISTNEKLEGQEGYGVYGEDTDGDGIFDRVGYKAIVLESDGKTEATDDTGEVVKNLGYTTGFIPVKYGETVYLKNCSLLDWSFYDIIFFYGSDKTLIGYKSAKNMTNFGGVFEERNLVQFNNMYSEDACYIRISCYKLSEDSIITVGQPIPDEPNVPETPDEPETPTDVENLIPLSTDASGNIYGGDTDGDGVLETVGYKTNTRTSSTGVDKTQSGYCTTGFIPITRGDILYFKNCQIDTTISAETYNEIACFDANKQYINKLRTGSENVHKNHIFYPKNTDDVYNPNGDNHLAWIDTKAFFEGTAFVRITGNYIGTDSIITVNQPIE